ncbi:hypothetical protein GX48_03329 [Paracoccidioides brasiliensis]|nr:hypothetical protein GX48_03329 [Paracoccidioides brasiliensis]
MDPKALSVPPASDGSCPSHSNSTSMTNLCATRQQTDTLSLSKSSGGNAGSTITSHDQPPSGAREEVLTRSAMSIEQSVRTFRLFEILRSGDTTAISKAIKECAEPHSQGTPPLGTSILHLAIQCVEPQIVEYILSSSANLDINARDRDGNTPLHLAAQLGRAPIVRELLERPDINDSATNYNGQIPLDLARTPEIFQQLQLARSIFLDAKTKEMQCLIGQGDYERLERLLVEPRVEGLLDVNSLDLVTDRTTMMTGGTLLHEAARKKDTKLIQILLMHGADPFRRDRKGKLPQDVTKDDRTRAIVKRSPAAMIAQRGIQEKAILGSAAGQGNPLRSGVGEAGVGGKDAREMKGYLKKWTNYTSGYKLRWFVLEDGVMSYYKHQDDAGSACRGAINMRIATLHMDAQDKTRFEIQGKSSVKYHLKANHVVEAKRWFWALNNAIQWTKDEAKEDDRRRTRNAESLRQAKLEQFDKQGLDSQSDSASVVCRPSGKNLAPPSSLGVLSHASSRLSLQTSRGGAESIRGEDESSNYAPNESTFSPQENNKLPTHLTSHVLEGEAEDDDCGDYASSNELQPSNKDAFNITAQSVRLQLYLLSNVSAALQAEKVKNPETRISDPSIDQALNAYEGAVSSLNSLVVDLLKISRDRDAFWQYRLDREADALKMWEDSMARVAQEHEELQSRIGESEEKRKRTKKALKEALEHPSTSTSRPISRGPSHVQIQDALEVVKETVTENLAFTERKTSKELRRKKSLITEFTNLSDSESDEDEEFFDAVDAGEVKVVEVPPEKVVEARDSVSNIRASKLDEIALSFKGYEDPIRKRLKMDADDRPKISLWAILKSMIGKDMTKMTLPVSFNEPTSLLQRVAEDMEYADLLDLAADRGDSMERMVYVAAFAASEYASTIDRVAKPFNPLLGETFEYVRPDKGYRFFIEQVSHHPPIGAAWAESSKWDYYGESAVKSKFYGKSFDINPLGTWFLRLRPISGGEELYTWKKITSSVVGIITGNPIVDNYGSMEIKNWTTGEVCMLDFKPRGWKASSAYHVSGKVMDSEGSTKWSIGGRWNDKIYARHTPGYQESVTPPHEDTPQHPESARALLVWQCHPRPTGIPFNLTPFVLTLNAIPDNLKPHLPPTDTRLRPDQRAMEDGEYDFAATEKHRVEEKQRAKRRERETKGEEFEPKWFSKGRCKITGEEFWVYNGRYWKCREANDWSFPMAMEFTCQKCAQALRLGIRPQIPAIRVRTLSHVGRRYQHLSTNASSLQASKAGSWSTKVRTETTTITNVASLSASQPTTSGTSEAYNGRPLLQPHNLFHSYSNSPSPEIRQRAAFIVQNAFCPHPSHRRTRVPTSPHDSEARKSPEASSDSQPPLHSQFECPDCGVPIYCSEEHWMDDFEAHLEVCDTIRQINEDDHDLRSGRIFSEFNYPGPQEEESIVNMTNWDTFLYTRQFDAINNDRNMRQVTRLLTYPVTIASVLHELSPYHIRKGGRLTPEGLKSLSALRYTLHPPRTGEGAAMSGLRLKAPPVRIFILGARAESSLPRDVWLQLSYLFPRALISLIFIGPESMANRDDEFPLPDRTPSNPFGAIVEDRLHSLMKITTYVDYFHTIHRANMFQPYDPYFDCFMLFHPGLGHPSSSHEWEETLPYLLETKVPILCTGYSEWDMKRDLDWVMEKCGGEVDLLLEPGENRFRSLRWDLNDMDPHDISCGNWGLWVFRGKRYVIRRLRH